MQVSGRKEVDIVSSLVLCVFQAACSRRTVVCLAWTRQNVKQCLCPSLTAPLLSLLQYNRGRRSARLPTATISLGSRATFSFASLAQLPGTHPHQGSGSNSTNAGYQDDGPIL